MKGKIILMKLKPTQPGPQQQNAADLEGMLKADAGL